MNRTEKRERERGEQVEPCINSGLGNSPKLVGFSGRIWNTNLNGHKLDAVLL